MVDFSKRQNVKRAFEISDNGARGGGRKRFCEGRSQTGEELAIEDTVTTISA